MRKPPLTERVLEGLADAYSRMEADDLTDLSDDELVAFEAAGKWLSKMLAFFREREEARRADA